MAKGFSAQRETLEALLAHLERRTTKVSSDLLREGGALSADREEQAVELENQDVLLALEKEGHSQITLVRDALARLEAGTYGTCTGCSGAIQPARLEALPYAPLCIKCAQERETAGDDEDE